MDAGILAILHKVSQKNLLQRHSCELVTVSDMPVRYMKAKVTTNCATNIQKAKYSSMLTKGRNIL